MYRLSADNCTQLIERGFNIEDIQKQIDRLREGTKYICIDRPCTINDGIRRLRSAEENRYRNLFASDKRTSVTKFVPASGAATRMFYEFAEYYRSLLEIPETEPSLFVREFIRQLADFAFYEELAACIEAGGKSLSKLLEAKDSKTIIDTLLSPHGLNYSALPKGLIPFHRYPDEYRTPFAEHLAEATDYARDNDRIVNIHFTVSERFLNKIKSHINLTKDRYRKIPLNISYSIQCDKTHTVSIDKENNLISESEGHIIFRPAGHGALLRNLSEIKSDIVFIKNIDNVAFDFPHIKRNRYKPILAGLLLSLREELFHYLEKLENKSITAKDIAEIFIFIKRELFINPPDFLMKSDHKTKVNYLKIRLNRPLRVCGMVVNSGKPGGGPFWIKDREFSLQIIESSQINMNNSEQKKQWQISSHYNPVDIVCSLTNRYGEPYDLSLFVDENSYFVSHKSHFGKPLKSLELPGLWNGSMAYWNTVFIEVPAESFNPVKNVFDLLLPAHSVSP